MGDGRWGICSRAHFRVRRVCMHPLRLQDPKSKKNSWRTQLAKLHIVSILLEVGGLQSQVIQVM